MKKSIFLFFAAILCAMSVNAEMIYLKTSANWREGSAEFWIHSWEGSDSFSARKMEYLGCGIYGSEAGNHTKCLFVRQKSGLTNIQWDGENKWYQTADLTIEDTKRCYKVVNWHENGTGWIATPTFPTIAGDEGLLGVDWTPGAAENKMTKQDDGTYTLVKTVTLEAKTYFFKVTDGTWDWSLGKNAYDNAELTISEAGEYNVTFTYNPTAETMSAVAEKVEAEEPEIPVEPTEDVYTIKGDDGLGLNWTVEDHADDMTKQAGGHYTLEKTELLLSASTTYNYKVIKNGSWDWSIPSGADNQTVTVDKDGKYDIVFTLSADLTTLTYAATLKEEVKVLPSIAMHGDFTGSWSDTDNFTASDDATKATLTLSNISAGSYSFGMRIGGSTNWTANSNVALSRTNNSAEIISGAGNCSFAADATGDYTFTWTYATNTLTVTYPAETGEEIQHTYTVVGPEAMFGTNWDPSNTANDMTKQEDGTYTKTIENVTLAAEAPNEYKIVRDRSWDWKELSDGANLTFSVDKSGIYNLTFVLNADATEASVTTSLLEETDVVLDAYVAGNEALTGSNFSLEEKNKMTYDSETKTYSHTLTGLKASTYYELKVVHGSSWLGYDKLSTVPQGVTEGNSQNICFQLASDGNLVVTYNATTGITLNGNFYVFDGSNQPSTLYFHPSANWSADEAEFAAYFFGKEEKWVNMTDNNSDGVYEVNNDKANPSVIFCRMNPNRDENRWNTTEDSEETKPLWGQTQDLTIPNAANELNTCYAFWKNDWNDNSGTWVAPTPLTADNYETIISTYGGETVNIVVERQFADAEWHTICLPFTYAADWFGKAYQLGSLINNGPEGITITTKECEKIEAGKPYLLKPNKTEGYDHVILSDVQVPTSVTAGTNSVTGAGYTVTLTANLKTNGTTTTEYWVGNGGYLYNGTTDKLGLRSYFTIPPVSSGMPPRFRVVTGENEATGIEDIITTDAPVKVIENGQLIIIRNGEKFNVQGQKL